MKKIFALFLAILMCLVCVSCTGETTMKITEKGRIIRTIITTATKKELNEYIAEIKASKGKEFAFLDGTFTMDEDTIDEFIEEIKIFKAEAKVKTIAGEKVYVKEEVESCPLKEINDYYLNSAYFTGEFTTTDIWMYQTSSSIFKEIQEDVGFESDYANRAKELFNIKVTTSYVFKMPYKIVATNGNVIDDYTVDVSNLSDVNYFYITTEKSTADWTKSQNLKEEIFKMAKSDLESIKPVAYVSFEKKTTANLFWNDNTYDKIIVQCKIGSGKWKTVATLDGNDCEYTHKKLKDNTKYSFRIQGYTTDDTLGTVYSDYSKTISLDTKVFNAPKATVKAGKNSFTVKVTKNYKGANAYEIRYSTNKNMKKAKKQVATKRTQKVKKLKKGTTYYVQVRKIVYSTFYKPLNSDWSTIKRVTVK